MKVMNDSNRGGGGRSMIQLRLGNSIARISLQGISKSYIAPSGKYLPSGEITIICTKKYIH